MQLTLPPNIPSLPEPIRHTDKLLLIGSCFTEHMSGRLSGHKFRVLQNPHGILFNPLSVAGSLDSYVSDKRYSLDDLFQLHGSWHSWDHHSRFSGMDPELTLAGINAAQAEAHRFIRGADWVLITLGSAFQYYLKAHGRPVANNHRAPAQWFEKQLLDTGLIIDALQAALDRLRALSPAVKVLFTISPVRHIRDGVVHNNRSKARLIEAVHTLCDRNSSCHYFAAYELVIDILRDYRFYDIDFVHPNYLATEFVWEQFVTACVDPAAMPAMEQVKDILTARNHRPRFPGTEDHARFLASYADKTERLQRQFPYLDLQEELAYFNRPSL